MNFNGKPLGYAMITPQQIKEAVNACLAENPDFGVANAVLYVAQSLTAEQKARARANIGAAAIGEGGGSGGSGGGSSDVVYVTATVENTDDADEVRFTANRSSDEITELALGDLLPVVLRFPYWHVNGNAFYCNLALVTADSGSVTFSGAIEKDDGTAEVITAYIEGDDDYCIARRHPVGGSGGSGGGVTDEHINSLIDEKLGVIENGTY